MNPSVLNGDGFRDHPQYKSLYKTISNHGEGVTLPVEEASLLDGGSLEGDDSDDPLLNEESPRHLHRMIDQPCYPLIEQFAIEKGPVEIVTFRIHSMVIFHCFWYPLVI